MQRYAALGRDRYGQVEIGALGMDMICSSQNLPVRVRVLYVHYTYTIRTYTSRTRIRRISTILPTTNHIHTYRAYLYLSRLSLPIHTYRAYLYLSIPIAPISTQSAQNRDYDRRLLDTCARTPTLILIMCSVWRMRRFEIGIFETGSHVRMARFGVSVLQ